MIKSYTNDRVIRADISYMNEKETEDTPDATIVTN